MCGGGPHRVSMTGVTGWWRGEARSTATAWRRPGRARRSAYGTNIMKLLSHGTNVIPGRCLRRLRRHPKAADSHQIAETNARSAPSAATHSRPSNRTATRRRRTATRASDSSSAARSPPRWAGGGVRSSAHPSQPPQRAAHPRRPRHPRDAAPYRPSRATTAPASARRPRVAGSRWAGAGCGALGGLRGFAAGAEEPTLSPLTHAAPTHRARPSLRGPVRRCPLRAARGRRSVCPCRAQSARAVRGARPPAGRGARSVLRLRVRVRVVRVRRPVGGGGGGLGGWAWVSSPRVRASG